MEPGIVATYVSGTSFSVAGDLTDDFAAGVRVLADCGVDGTPLGTVTAASYADGATTVTVALDSGALTANLTLVWHGNDIPASLCNHGDQHMLGGRDALAPEDIGAMPAERRIDTVAPLYGGGDLWSDLELGISAATTSAPGAVELATSAESVSGTDTARAVPAVALRQAYRSWQRDDAGRFPGLILPAYNLFAPGLALPGTTTFSRASSGWVVGAAGVIKSYATNLPRFDYDASGNLLGLRIEGASTRLNLYAAAPTAAENVAVTAQAYTVSFYGTGSVALSGAHSATVTGAGVLPARASYTFTPSAGTLTLTPTGTVQHLQVEAGTLPTSPILGEGSQVARSADVATVALSGIEWNAAEGTLFVAGRTPGGAPASNQLLAHIDDGTANNRIYVTRLSTRVLACYVATGGVGQAALSFGVVADNTDFRMGFAWAASGFRASINGGDAVTGGAGSIPAGLTTLRVGSPVAAANMWNGPIRHLAYFPRALTADQIQAMTL